MKKFVLLFTVLLALDANVRAQDTVQSYYPKSNCYYNYWLDTDMTITQNRLPVNFRRVTTAVYFETEDSLPIYGIAAALGWETYDYAVMLDTTLNNSYEYLGLYKMESSGLTRISDSLYVPAIKGPIGYYFDPKNTKDSSVFYEGDSDLYPVYECYFNTPVVVTDSFYVGVTNLSWKCVFDSLEPSFVDTVFRPYAVVRSYVPQTDTIHWSPIRILFENKVNGAIRYTYWGYDHYGIEQPFYPYMFPILAPPDTTSSNPSDTTIVDTTTVDTTVVDTVGISVRLLERYIGLQPNPAAERVLVTSSFGLRRIELFNAAGLRVHGQEATGYSAVLDIRALPDGPYLVRIATPRGSVTKKLLVQRR